MANPNPVLPPKFLESRFERLDDTEDKLSPQPLQVRVEMPVYQAVRAMGKRKTPWLRRVITEAAQRELMGNAPQAGLGNSDVAVTNYGESPTGPGADVPNLGATSGPGEKPETTPRGNKRVRKPKGES